MATIYRWSDFIGVGPHSVTGFDPLQDLLRFDDGSTSAAEVSVTALAGPAVTFVYLGKSLTLDIDIRALVGSSAAGALHVNVRFADGSVLLVGDNLPSRSD